MPEARWEKADNRVRSALNTAVDQLMKMDADIDRADAEALLGVE